MEYGDDIKHCLTHGGVPAARSSIGWSRSVASGTALSCRS